MNKFVSHIDIAQEDGTTNPSAAHSRIKAKTNGQLVSRSSVGVEGALGGSVSVQSSIVAQGTAGASTLVVIPGLAAITIPPGKTASIVLLGYTAGAVSSPTSAIGFRFSQPAGADGGLSGCAKGKNSTSTAAAASANYRADVVNVAAGTTADFTVTVANSSTPKVHANAFAVIRNNSTNAIATVEGLISAVSALDISGTSIFALIS